MLEKRKREAFIFVDPRKAILDSVNHRAKVIRAEIRKFFSLNVSPGELYGIQVWGIWRQSQHSQAAALCAQVLEHAAAAMRRKTIPDQDKSSAMELLAQLCEKEDQLFVSVTVRDYPEK